MEKLFYLYYELRPRPGSDCFDELGGAFLSCWIQALDQLAAERSAAVSMESRGFEAVALLEARVVKRNDFRSQPEWAEYLDQAEADGESYRYDAWPPEPQDEDSIH